MYPYHRLSEEKLLNEEQDAHQKPVKPSFNRFCNYYLLFGICQAILFAISSTMFFRSLSQRDMCSCQDYTPSWSPALEAVKGTEYKQRFDGSFATPNAFKGPPSPEIDAAWDNITYAKGMFAADNDLCALPT
jgi:hypothetical protein